MRTPVQAPYDGPYKVLHSAAKFFTIDLGHRTDTISIDRLKPANLDRVMYLPVPSDTSTSAANATTDNIATLITLEPATDSGDYISAQN